MPDLSGNHIAGQAGQFEPQRTYDFAAELFGVPNQGNLILAVEKAFIPEVSIEEIAIHWFASTRKVAGQVSYKDGVIVFTDYVNQGILSALYAWHAMVYSPVTGAQGYASNYKRAGAIVLYGPDGGGSRVMAISGAWPKVVSGDDPAMTSNAALKVTLTLAIDTAIPLF
jgi:hypothetical protein